jgi:hypothetical protein
MGAKHTPGPWVELETESSVDFAYDDAPRLGGWSDIGPEDGAPVAIALGYGGFSDRRLDANARLIASAPDLLASLIEVVAIADRKTDAFDRARAAIARATGEAA